MFCRKEDKTDLDKFREFVEACGFSTITTSDGPRRIVELSGRSTDGKICYDDPLVALSFDNYGMLELGDEWYSEERDAERMEKLENKVVDIANAQKQDFDARVAESLERLGHVDIPKLNPDSLAVARKRFKEISEAGVSVADLHRNIKKAQAKMYESTYVAPDSVSQEEFNKAAESITRRVESRKLKEQPNTLPPHIMRMVEEANELKIKRDALQSYINGHCEDMPDDNRVNVRLRAQQLAVMSSYHKILKDRIANETLKHFGGES